MRRCASPYCERYVYDENDEPPDEDDDSPSAEELREDLRHCTQCREYVWACQWRQGERGREGEYDYVIESLLGEDTLTDGMEVAVDQCLDCGIPVQVVTSTCNLVSRRPVWYLICDDWTDRDGTVPGCGRRLQLYKVKQYKAHWVS